MKVARNVDTRVLYHYRMRRSMHEPPTHMSPDEFRAHGRAVIDWIADYMERVETLPVLSNVKPGDIRAQLPTVPPQTGEPFENMLRDINTLIMPGITHWQSPNFFGFFPANTSGSAILGDLLSTGLGVQGMLWATSPACTEMETHVLDWLVEMLDLPKHFKSTSNGGGVLQDTASSSTLCALLAARERSSNWATNDAGIDRRFTCYTSNQAHSSIEKAAMVAGIGRGNVRLIDVDDTFAMNVESLQHAIDEDIAAGHTPCFVCATVGTTSSNAIDSVRKIGELCKEYNIWLHVDAAMSGTAGLCEEFRWIHDGLELAESYTFNPHKWMLTTFDCNCFYVRDRAALIKTLSILPEYLRNQATDSGAVFDYRDWHIPLGRRFRSLKLWFVICSYGIDGLQQHVRHHIAIAQQFAQWVRESDDFELAVEPPLNLVCFRHNSGDAFNEQLLAAVNETGNLYITHTKLAGRYTLRMSIGATHTELRHVEAARKIIQETAKELARVVMD